jgi:putative transposase
VEIFQAFKYELRPNEEQMRKMVRFAGSCRYVYNKALTIQKERHENGLKNLKYAELCRLLTEWRNSPETAWLAETPCAPLQQALKNLERAYKNFFEKRADVPTPKLKNRHDSFRYPAAFKVDEANDRIFLPKLGWMRYRNSRKILGEVRNVTVSRQADKWFVSIQTRREVDLPPQKNGVVGIDLGVARFATFSDGDFVEPIDSFKKHEKRLKKAQKKLSRIDKEQKKLSKKEKGSKNRRKALRKLQRIHAKIANVRKDFLHKHTARITKNHGVVVVEDLRVKNMSASAKGTTDNPGKNVKAKSGLNKSILDQGWYEFRRQLEYKMTWSGGRLVAAPAHNTSRTCPACGHVSRENRRTQSKFACVKCGFEGHADVVGATNILSRGMQILRDEGRDTSDASLGMQYAASPRMACGSNQILGVVAAVAGIMPGGSPKQEPAEVIACESLACNAVGIPSL